MELLIIIDLFVSVTKALSNDGQYTAEYILIIDTVLKIRNKHSNKLNSLDSNKLNMKNMRKLMKWVKITIMGSSSW